MRPDLDEYMMSIAILASMRATCPRRSVGCVLTNSHGYIIATGYNGVAKGTPHCIMNNCAGAKLASGTGLDSCQAIHAEQNALLQCRNVLEIDTAYCTASPCSTCLKMLQNTSCRRIVFLEEYPGNDVLSANWRAMGREWIKHEPKVLVQSVQSAQLYAINEIRNEYRPTRK